jgi:hypothetical protein
MLLLYPPAVLAEEVGDEVGGLAPALRVRFGKS